MQETFIIHPSEAALMQHYGLEAAKLRNCSVRSYTFGEKVVSEDISDGYLFLVLEGKAKVSLSSPGGEHLILCFYISEGLMGEVEFFSQTPVGSTTVTALDGFRCIAIPTDCNKEYLNHNLAFTHIAAAELSDKLMRSSMNVVERTLYSSEVRLCRYILSTSVNHHFRDIMTDVACSVGVSYRHLYRMMQTLCDNGILKKTDSGYQILDFEELTRRCQYIG